MLRIETHVMHEFWLNNVLFSGCCYMKPLLVPGGRAFVWPSVQRVQRYKNKFSIELFSNVQQKHRCFVFFCFWFPLESH